MSQLVTPLLETTRLCGPPPARMVKLLEEQSAASTNATRAHSSHRLLLKLVDELEQRLELFYLLRFACELPRDIQSRELQRAYKVVSCALQTEVAWQLRKAAGLK